MILRQSFKITGVANNVVPADPIISTAAERKRLLYIKMLLNGQADNFVQLYHESSLVSEIPDRLLDVELDAFNTDVSKPGARINEIEVGFEIPVGEKMLVALKCGATAKNAHGYYAYELIA